LDANPEAFTEKPNTTAASPFFLVHHQPCAAAADLFLTQLWSKRTWNEKRGAPGFVLVFDTLCSVEQSTTTSQQ